MILDIPCGTGRHSIEFARLGYKVTASDFSKVLLQEAKKRTVSGNLLLNFIKGDMRSIRLSRKYDAIVNLGNSFGYFSDDDNAKVIKNFSRLLKPRGVIALDLPNTAGMMRKIGSSQKIKIKGGYILAEQVSFDPLKMIVALRWTVCQGKRKNVLRGALRIYTFPEIKKLLEESNLHVTNIYGSFSGNKYSIDTPRMIILAHKRK